MLLFNLLASFAFAIPRIENKRVLQDVPTQIQLKYGLVSVLEFPKDISEVRLGNPNVIKAIISNISGRELTLYYKVESSASTNLIVKSGKDTYVLDIIPSKSTHQDYVRIKGNAVANSSLKVIENIPFNFDRNKNSMQIEEVIKL